MTILSVQPDTGRRLIVRHGPLLHRVHVHPVQRIPRTPAEEPGWLPLLVSSEFTDVSAQGLTDSGVSFLDERGNAHLSLDGRTVLFARAGKTRPTGLRATPGPPAPATRAAGVLALNRASHRVAFALLANPVLAGGPGRAMAAAAALDSHVRATDGIVYATALGPAVTLLRLKTDPTPFRVDVRERFWEDLLPTPQTGLVPSVLIYGDVLRDGDARSRDIAANLRRNDAHLRALG